MSPFATVNSLRQAGRLIKRLMNHHPEGWGDLKDAGREGFRRCLEEEMDHRVRCWLEDSLGRGEQDRRNESYRRHFRTALGDIEVSIPRTRHFSPVSVAQAYARRSGDVDRAILACFVLGLSTRKVAEALLPILGERVSASTVSRVSRVLDAEVEAFHDKVRVGDWEEVKRDLRRIYGAKNRMRAIQAAIRFGDRWDGLYHAAVRCLMKDLDELLNHYDLKESEWQRMSRTTNAIERRFREVRRRTRPMGAFIRAVRTPRPGDCGVLCGSNESPLGDTARSRS